MSLFMPAPFHLAADVIPESVLGGTVRQRVETSELAEFVKGQTSVEATVFVERLVQATVGDHTPVNAEPAVRQPVNVVVQFAQRPWYQRGVSCRLLIASM